MDAVVRIFLPACAWRGGSLQGSAPGRLCQQFRFGFAFVVGVLGFAGGGFAQEKSRDAEVIYPRTAQPVDAPAAAGKSGSSNATLILLALGAAAAGGWVLWRQRNAVGGGSAAGRKLSIAESRPLGNRQHLVVADYDGRKFLLGVCPGRIDLLAPLDESEKDGDA